MTRQPASLLALVAAASLAVCCARSEVAGAGSGSAPAPALSQPTGEDEDTSNRVKASLLEDPQVKAFGIEVSTREGVVFLTGSVEDEPERQRAIRLARETKGVRHVQASLSLRRG